MSSLPTSPYCPHCMQWRGHKATCPMKDGTGEPVSTDYSLAAYHEFLKRKATVSENLGYCPDMGTINPWLKPHQKTVVQWAVHGGRRAIFASFGLGKTVIQLETLRLILEWENKQQCLSANAGPATLGSTVPESSSGTNAATVGKYPAADCVNRALIVAPLGVRQEFKRDAQKLGIDLRFIRSMMEVEQLELEFAQTDQPRIFLTNYETVRDGKLDPRHFVATSLDEAACFPAGTLVDTPNGPAPIETLKPGDRILNAAGTDTIRAIHHPAVHRAVRIHLDGSAVISSDNHRFFTGRGWVRADDLRPGDSIVETAAAVRLLWEHHRSENLAGSPKTILQSILLSELASLPTLDHCQNGQDEKGASSLTHQAGSSLETAEDLRMVRKDIHAEVRLATEETLLREHLFSTMANEPTGEKRTDSGMLAHAGSSRETRNENQPMVGSGISESTGGETPIGESWSHPQPTIASEDGRNTSAPRNPANLDWRQGTRPDEASTASVGKPGTVPMGLRMARPSEPQATGNSNVFLSGHRATGNEDLYRSRWRVTSDADLERTGCQENSIPGVSRVDRVEILEPGHPGLDKFRDAGGTLNFYDLSAIWHPSYSVNGLLVHNCLRGFGGTKTFREFMRVFETVKYRFVATATPDPNEYIELLAYAAYLGIMDVSQAKTRFFKRDSTKADKLTIHPHKEAEFWLWVASWALFLRSPSDLGFSDEGYALTDLEVIHHEVPVDHTQGAKPERDGQYRLYREALHGVVDAAHEKRETLHQRVAKMRKILDAEPEEHFLLWHDLEAERHAIAKAVPEAVCVWGSMKTTRQKEMDEREQAVIDFSDGKVQYLAGKPVMLGSGCNFQRHCARAIFVGIGFKFADFIQAVHRIHRFLQERPVKIHLIYAESEKLILKSLLDKWERHKKRAQHMSELIQQYGLSQAAMIAAMGRSLGVERLEIADEGYRMVNNDCVDETHRMADNSVHLILTSIPFSTQYEYSPNYCYDELTEVLSRRGWISFSQLTAEDSVCTMNLETRTLEWQVPSRLVWEPYNGDMIHFKNRHNFDLMVTPNHGMIADTRVGNHISGRKTKSFKRVAAAEIRRTFVHRKYRFLNAANPGTGHSPEFIDIPFVQLSRKGPKPQDLKQIKTADLMELAGWYLSEGYCDGLSSKHAGRITICQCDVHPENRKQIQQLFERIGLPGRYEKRSVVGHNAGVAKFLMEQFGSGSHFKHIPRWVKDLHPDLLCILRDTMMKGDGTATGFAYTSFSEQLRNDFQEICLFTGWRAAIYGTNVGIGRKQLFPEVRELPEGVPYSGMIGCATVPNGTLVVRRNGVAVISGNSDFGHTDDNQHFFQQMNFLTPELLRVLKPGRLAAIHVKDRIVPGGITGLGFQTVYPFHCKCIEHYTSHGFAFMGMKTIVTDVVRENNQTYRMGWTEQCKDGTKMGYGMPEYLLLFRKPPTDTSNAYADEPVVKSKSKYSRSRWQIDAHGFTRSSGNRPLMPSDLEGVAHAAIFKMFRKYSLEQVYDFEHHVHLGEVLEAKGILPVTFMLLQPQSWHPDVWTDITRMLTLNGAQSAKGKEMHVCPLQFDLADRVIAQNSAEGETVYDPFAGLGTVPMRAIKQRRKAIGVELSASYFTDALTYLRMAAREAATPTLFDLIETEESEDGMPPQEPAEPATHAGKTRKSKATK